MSLLDQSVGSDPVSLRVLDACALQWDEDFVVEVIEDLDNKSVGFNFAL